MEVTSRGDGQQEDIGSRGGVGQQEISSREEDRQLR